jgi:Family of unknown function (DUF6338)
MLRDVETTVKLVLALAPGFLALALLGLIADLDELNEFRILFYGLALTFVCWVIVLAVLGVGRIFFKRLPTEPSNHPALLFMVFLVAVAVGIGTGMAAERDTFHAVLRSLPGTTTINKRSTKRPLPFLLAQNTAGRLREDGDGRPGQKATEAFIRIFLREGRIYDGWPEFYGTERRPSEVYLSPACRAQKSSDGSFEVTMIPGPGVLVAEAEIQVVEFLDRKASECFDLWRRASESTASAPSKANK